MSYTCLKQVYLWALAVSDLSTSAADLHLFASSYAGQFSSRIDAAHAFTAMDGGDADTIADEAKEQARLGGACSDPCSWDAVIEWASPGRIRSQKPALRKFLHIVVGSDPGGNQAMSA